MVVASCSSVTTKRDVIIYDYVDEREPLLGKMSAKREAGYRSLGYAVAQDQGTFSLT